MILRGIILSVILFANLILFRLQREVKNCKYSKKLLCYYKIITLCINISVLYLGMKFLFAITQRFDVDTLIISVLAIFSLMEVIIINVTNEADRYGLLIMIKRIAAFALAPAFICTILLWFNLALNYSVVK